MSQKYPFSAQDIADFDTPSRACVYAFVPLYGHGGWEGEGAHTTPKHPPDAMIWWNWQGIPEGIM